MSCRGMIGGRKTTVETTTFLTILLDDYMRKHDQLCLSHPLKDYIPVPLLLQECPQFFFLFFSTISHSLLDQHQSNWNQELFYQELFYLTNTNGFPAELTVLCTSCSPLLADFMVDKGQAPTLSFLNVLVTKMC